MGGRGSREARKKAHENWVSKKKKEGWVQKTVWVPPGHRVKVVDETAIDSAHARIQALEKELAKAREWQDAVKRMGLLARIFKRWPNEIAVAK